MKKIHLIIIAFCVISITSNAQLYIKNKSCRPVSVAVGWLNEKTNLFESKGWYQLNPGETTEKVLVFTTSNESFYFYAKGYEGDFPLLVNKNSFYNKNAGNFGLTKESSDEFVGMFKEVNVSFSFWDSYTYTLDINDGDFNPYSYIEINANLVYEDGTVSSFDIINSPSIVLWNTIIGAGDAEKPSNKTRFSIVIPQGYSDVEFLITNGITALHQSGKLNSLSGNLLKMVEVNTGCETIYFIVKEYGKEVINKKIEFHCGE